VILRVLRSPLPAVVALALGVVVTWIVLTPFSWDNDEQGHYWTARDIYLDGRLPVSNEFPAAMFPSQPKQAAGQFRYHALPPTYYVIVAALFNVQPGADAGLLPGALIGRGFSAFLYVLAVVAVYHMARLFAAGNEDVAALLAAGFAMIPQVASTGASITADALVLTSVSLLGWASVHAVRRDWDWTATACVGLASALILMSRPSALPVLLVPMVMFAGSARRDMRKLVIKAMAIVGLAVVPNLWWMIRNLVMFGEPLGATAHVGYMDVKGVYAATSEFAMYKAESGWIGLPNLLFSTDWLLRFHTRLWFTGRYDSLSLFGWILAAALTASILIAILFAIGRLRPQCDMGIPKPLVRVTPAALLVVFVATACLAALTSLEYGAFVVGRFSTPVLGLFLVATMGLFVTTRWKVLSRGLVATFVASMMVGHLVFWVGYVLPDLSGEVVPH
jgi:hypothetical protein